MTRATTTLYSPKSEVARQQFCLTKPLAYIIKVDRIQTFPPKYRITYDYNPDYKYVKNGKTYTGPSEVCRESCSNPKGKDSAGCVAWRQKINAQNIPDTVNPFSGGGGDGGNDAPPPLDISKIAIYMGIGLIVLLVISSGAIGTALYIKKKKKVKKK